MGVVVVNTHGVIPVDERGRYINVDAFGNLKVSHPYTLTDYNFKYEIDTTLFGVLTATGGTITQLPNQSAAQFAVTGSNGSRALLRTHEFYRYQSGKALSARFSVVHNDAGQTNQVRRWGIFSDDNGLFFELSGTSLRAVRRTFTSGSTVDNATASGSWNVDKMDGTGPSQMTLDVTKGSIYEIQYQWLGVGVTKFFVNGYLVHEERHSNQLTVPYMTTGQLPVSYEVVNTGASSASGMRSMCGSVVVDGGMEAPESFFGAFNSTDVTVTTTERPLLSIRPKLTYNGVTNRMQILPVRFFVSNEGGRAGFRIVASAALTGASFASADPASGVEFDVAATALTGGRTLSRAFLPNANDARDLSADYFKQNGNKLLLDAFGSIQPILTVTGVNEAGGSGTMRASIGWLEIR